MAFTGVYSYRMEARRMWFVSHSVGAAASNWWTDIMLVQYFIRNIYFANERIGEINIWSMTAATRADMPDLPDPQKDYKALKKTAKWIRNFQIDATSVNSFPLVADGRVDVGESINEGFGPTEKLKTIHYLNVIYQNSMAKIGIEDWFTWAINDPALPSQVKVQLMHNHR